MKVLTSYRKEQPVTGYEGQFGQRQDVSGQQDTADRPADVNRDASTATEFDDQQDMTERARETADQAREAIDQPRERASKGMEAAADRVREHADQIPGGQRTTDIANQAADRVEGIAGYIQNNDMSTMLSDLEQIVRDHPKESLIAAAAIGFFVARAVRS
jgi:ElaB/YqjD/DUF883 family membrane-anchored ribosome-binding protein